MTELSLHADDNPETAFGLGMSLQGSWSTNLEQLRPLLPVWQASEALNRGRKEGLLTQHTALHCIWHGNTAAASAHGI